MKLFSKSTILSICLLFMGGCSWNSIFHREILVENEWLSYKEVCPDRASQKCAPDGDFYKIYDKDKTRPLLITPDADPADNVVEVVKKTILGRLVAADENKYSIKDYCGTGAKHLEITENDYSSKGYETNLQMKLIEKTELRNSIDAAVSASLSGGGIIAAIGGDKLPRVQVELTNRILAELESSKLLYGQYRSIALTDDFLLAILYADKDDHLKLACKNKLAESPGKDFIRSVAIITSHGKTEDIVGIKMSDLIKATLEGFKVQITSALNAAIEGELSRSLNSEIQKQVILETKKHTSIYAFGFWKPDPEIMPNRGDDDRSIVKKGLIPASTYAIKKPVGYTSPVYSASMPSEQGKAAKESATEEKPALHPGVKLPEPATVGAPASITP